MGKKRYPVRDPAAYTAKAQSTLLERFWAKVVKKGPNDCWTWTARVNNAGYGQIYVGWNPKGYADLKLVHRISYEIHHGPIPEGHVIDHICRNRVCVNPRHIRAVTPKVNGLENNLSPLAAMARRTHCQKCGNPLSGENLAMYTAPNPKTRHGRPSKPKPSRICLTCFPNYWRWAVIPRPAPGRVRKPVSKIMQARQEGGSQ